MVKNSKQAGLEATKKGNNAVAKVLALLLLFGTLCVYAIAPEPPEPSFLLVIALVILTVLFAFRLTNRRLDKEIRYEQEGPLPKISIAGKRIGYNRITKTMILVWSVVVYISLLISLLFASSGQSDLNAVSLTKYLIVPILPIPFLIEVFLSHYYINSQGIGKRYFWRQHRSMDWDEVDAIKYNGRIRSFIVTNARDSLHLFENLNGLPDFARAVVAYVPSEKWADAQTVIEMYAFSK